MTDNPKVPIAEDLQELRLAAKEFIRCQQLEDETDGGSDGPYWWIEKFHLACEAFNCGLPRVEDSQYDVTSLSVPECICELIQRTSRAEAALEVVERERTALENICQYGVEDGSPDRMLRDHRRYESWCLHQAQNPDQSEQAKWMRLACGARAFIKQYGDLDAQENLIDRCKKAEAALEALQWTPITPENLPEPGDEVLCWNNGQAMVGNVLEPLPLKRFRFEAARNNGWTHRRPLNPPRIEEKPNE